MKQLIEQCGYRFILQEVGFLTQNISLLAEFLGLGSCIQNVIVIGKNKEVQNDHVTSK